MKIIKYQKFTARIPNSFTRARAFLRISIYSSPEVCVLVVEA